MAIFETGGATSNADLLDKLVTFAVANGWTSNFNAVEGVGRRAHLQLGADTFFNFRALQNETTNGSANNFGIACNGSTGYDAGQQWHNQPNAPKDAATTYRKVGIKNVTGAIPAYYFHARGNMIIVIVEYTAGMYQFLLFGKITKAGTWAGGQMCAGSNDLQSSAVGGAFANYQGFAGRLSGFLAGDISGNEHAFMYGTVDGNTGWMQASSSYLTTPVMPYFFDTVIKQAGIATNIANTFNTLPVLLPVDLCIVRDGVQVWAQTSNFSIEGSLPDIYMVNLRTLVPAQQLDDGSGNIFRVYPWRQKSTNGILGAGTSGWFGFAVKEN